MIVTELARFLDIYGLIAIFAVMLLKEIGIPVPVPSDLIMLAAASQAAAGKYAVGLAFGVSCWQWSAARGSSISWRAGWAGHSLIASVATLASRKIGSSARRVLCAKAAR